MTKGVYYIDSLRHQSLSIVAATMAMQMVFQWFIQYMAINVMIFYAKVLSKGCFLYS